MLHCYYYLFIKQLKLKQIFLEFNLHLFNEINDNKSSLSLSVIVIGARFP